MSVVRKSPQPPAWEPSAAGPPLRAHVGAGFDAAALYVRTDVLDRHPERRLGCCIVPLPGIGQVFTAIDPIAPEGKRRYVPSSALTGSDYGRALQLMAIQPVLEKDNEAWAKAPGKVRESWRTLR